MKIFISSDCKKHHVSPYSMGSTFENQLDANLYLVWFLQLLYSCPSSKEFCFCFLTYIGMIGTGILVHIHNFFLKNIMIN